MPSIPVKNLAGQDVGSVDVSDAVFAAPANETLVHQAVVRLMANARLGTHKTKTRGMVSGGGAKPWRQKGTGRARQGSRVSPVWRGGGIVFGPVPRSYRQDMPKKMRQSAMRSALSSRFAEGAVTALDEFSLSEPRTKDVAQALTALGLTGNILLVDDRFEHNAFVSARNIPGVELVDSGTFNIIDVLGPAHIVFTKSALASVDSRLSSEAK